MKISASIATLFFALISPICLHGQGSATASTKRDAAKFAGVWRGQFDNLPGVEMVISNEGGEFTGAILFYLHMRQDEHSPWTSTPKSPAPMFNMKLDGNTLRFRVSHKGAHPPGTLNDPPVSFRLILSSSGTAQLVNEGEGGMPPMVLTRTDY
jgi:hypothetical protein